MSVKNNDTIPPALRQYVRLLHHVLLAQRMYELSWTESIHYYRKAPNDAM